jgi:integrase
LPSTSRRGTTSRPTASRYVGPSGPHSRVALCAGIHPKVVSERLGHATVSITLDTYSHAIPAMQEEAAALIAGLVFAGE